MIYSTDQDSAHALSTLRKTLESESDDTLRANVLMAALSILEKNKDVTCKQVTEVVSEACIEPGPQIHFCCARALSYHANLLDAHLVELLLHTLQSVDTSQTGTISELDSGLQNLLGTTHANKAIEFLETLLPSAKGNLDLSMFAGFSERLISGPAERYHRLVVTWLLSERRELCEGISFLLSNQHGQLTPLEFDIKLFNLSQDQQIFLCKKAIGYLFNSPVAAASILVSVLRNCTAHVADQASQLLFDPLFLNYGGGVKVYLEGIQNSDLAYSHAQLILKQGSDYVGNLKSVNTIKELHPSENERQIEQLRFNDTMEIAIKEAEKKSVFLNLVSRSVLLYGKRSITYMNSADNQRRAVEMKLQSFSTAIEFPRMGIVDPVGLDYMLRIFRAERMPQ